MAFKLTKDEIARRAKILEELNELRGKLEDAVSVYNAALETAKTPLNEALEKYNEAVEETRGFAEDIANQADSDFDEKSEKWQGGEKGEAASSWKDEWENADFDAEVFEYASRIGMTMDAQDAIDLFHFINNGEDQYERHYEPAS